MLLISIVDDDAQDTGYLSKLIENHFHLQETAYAVRTYASALEFVRSPENSDIILMDISMEKLDGLEAARILRRLGSEAAIIFVTHRAELAIRGYEVDAVDFLVKPASQAALSFALDKAVDRIANKTCTILALKLPSGTISVSSNDITYVEVFDHNLVYHTTKGQYTVRGRLSDVYQKLDQRRFILCNRSFIVNLRYVSSINTNYLMVEGTKVSISNSHQKEIMQRFSDLIENENKRLKDRR